MPSRRIVASLACALLLSAGCSSPQSRIVSELPPTPALVATAVVAATSAPTASAVATAPPEVPAATPAPARMTAPPPAPALAPPPAAGAIATAVPTTSIATAPPSAVPLVVSGTGSSGVILRRSPDGERIASANEGEQVAGLSETAQAGGREWRRVRAPNGTEGWVAGEFLAVPSAPPVARPSPPAVVAAAPTQTAVPPPPATPTRQPSIIAATPFATARPAAPAPTTASVLAPTPPGSPALIVAASPTSRLPIVAAGTLCADGWVSSSSGSGTCSSHGGIAGGAPSTSSAVSRPSTSPGGSVNVSGYTRRDGTYVRPHTRSAPRR